jgi:hypothetical protein
MRAIYSGTERTKEEMREAGDFRSTHLVMLERGERIEEVRAVKVNRPTSVRPSKE